MGAFFGTISGSAIVQGTCVAVSPPVTPGFDFPSRWILFQRRQQQGCHLFSASCIKEKKNLYSDRLFKSKQH